MQNNFWVIWLRFSAILTFFTGLVSSFASTESGSYLWLFLFDLLTYPIDGNPSKFYSESFALNAVLGGVMVGWSVLIYLLIEDDIQNNKKNLRFILISLICWFIVDSVGSYFAGINGNIVLNIGFLFLYLPPLIKLLK